MEQGEPLTEEQLEELRGALEAEKDSVEEELNEHGEQVGDDEWAGASMLEGEEADPSDAADQIEEFATNTPLVGNLNARRKEIEDALDRMKNGSYGTCEKCGEWIPFDRLEANAAAKTCVEHAA